MRGQRVHLCRRGFSLPFALVAFGSGSLLERYQDKIPTAIPGVGLKTDNLGKGRTVWAYDLALPDAILGMIIKRHLPTTWSIHRL